MNVIIKTTDTQTIRILAKILLGIFEGKEMNQEEVKMILTEISNNGFYIIKKKEDEEDE